MKPECGIDVKDKIIVFEENRSKLVLLNPLQIKVRKIIVDGCEITVGIRCDYLCLAKDIEHYIELKGQDLDHALKQIERTISLLSTDKKKQLKISFIICTRSPATSASIQNLQTSFRRNYNSYLIIKSSPHEYKL